MVQLQRIKPRWAECVIAATGPSLTQLVVDQIALKHWRAGQVIENPGARTIQVRDGWRVLAVNDAYRLMPWADLLYACDAKWWEVHQGCPGFAGEKWSSHSEGSDDKLDAAARWGLTLVCGAHEDGFSLDPGLIHYGSVSGFQAINLALLMGAKRILLVGYDMRVNGRRHFFGNHPDPLTNAMRFEALVPQFARAAHHLPPEIKILNCTPGSALDCFPMSDLEAALHDR